MVTRFPTGTRALVTGGAGGLGSACAERLLSEGVEVVTVDVGPSATYRCDLTDAAAVSGLVDEVGAVDVLINSAGIQGPEAELVETSLEDWQRVFKVNTEATFLMCRAFAPGMCTRGWGRIINIASMAGKEGNAGQSAYSASKAAVIALTKSLGKELAGSGVLVNAITPAIIRTAMNRDTDPETFARLLDRIPLGRAGEPGELAALVSWLASDECSFSTGAVYDLSGGRATY